MRNLKKYQYTFKNNFFTTQVMKLTEFYIMLLFRRKNLLQLLRINVIQLTSSFEFKKIIFIYFI